VSNNPGPDDWLYAGMERATPPEPNPLGCALAGGLILILKVLPPILIAAALAIALGWRWSTALASVVLYAGVRLIRR